LSLDFFLGGLDFLGEFFKIDIAFGLVSFNGFVGIGLFLSQTVFHSL
jgi:hypothetical protein